MAGRQDEAHGFQGLAGVGIREAVGALEPVRRFVDARPT